MKTLLKLNYFLFSWYYRRVDRHFHQWTFFKSVKMLISNYEHELLLKNNAEQSFSSALKELNETRHELSNIKMQQIAKHGQIETINKIFGTDFNDSINN